MSDMPPIDETEQPRPDDGACDVCAGTGDGRASRLCVDCGEHYADLPSKLCPGCEAYRERQA